MPPLPTKILPKTLLDVVKRQRPIYQLGRKARFAIGSRMGARYVPALRSRAHYNDFMLSSTTPEHVQSYRLGAVEFVDILGRSLREAGRDFGTVQQCLEVGCGYGRIVRELLRELPPDAISVCDLIEEGARFTAAEFGVHRLAPVEALGGDHDGGFDLVYLLSVYTHLDRGAIEANLARVAALLRPGGVLAFTTHGTGSAAQLQRYGQYWLDGEVLNERLERDGFFYQRYPYYYAEYGLTWMIADETKRLVAAVAPQLDFVAHHPLAVDGHQDVFVYRAR